MDFDKIGDVEVDISEDFVGAPFVGETGPFVSDEFADVASGVCNDGPWSGFSFSIQDAGILL